jgi:outer membrane protein assembly factor BamE
MVVVLALVQFIDSFTGFKTAAGQQTSLFKLHQNPVHGGQTNVRTVFEQNAKHVLCGHVPFWALLKNLQNFESGQCGFESGVFKFFDIRHGWLTGLTWVVGSRINCRPPQGLQCLGSYRYGLAIAHGFYIHRKQMKFRPCLTHLSNRSLLSGMVIAAGLGLSACSSTSAVNQSLISLGGVLTPYKADVLQGNVITREQVTALQTGMPREQVRNILGTPLLNSAFHADRWDYLFTFRRQGQAVQQRRVTVFFRENTLERVQVDAELPTEQEFVSSLDVKRKNAPIPLLQATETDLKAFAEAHPVLSATTPSVPAAAPAASYPPLESR